MRFFFRERWGWKTRREREGEGEVGVCVCFAVHDVEFIFHVVFGVIFFGLREGILGPELFPCQSPPRRPSRLEVVAYMREVFVVAVEPRQECY